jgi:hypothetical protein
MFIPSLQARHQLLLTAIVAATLVVMPASALAKPANDDFADARAVTVPEQVSGSITAATLQAGEPDPSEEGLSISVWYRFEATVDGPVKLDTCDSAVYARAAVYTGAAVNALTEIAHGNGACDGGGRAHFTAVAGTTYHIALTAYSGDSGAIALELATPTPPANDDFSAAQPVTLPSTVGGTIDDATLQAGEPDPSEEGRSISAWYSYTADTGGMVKIDSCASTFFARVAVYTGSSVGGLSELSHSDGGCQGGGRAYFAAIAATTYHIAVTAYSDDTGAIALTIERPQPPPNDNFANARALGMPESAAGSNVDATREAGEPDILGDGTGHSVWYKLTLGTTQGVGIDTCGSDIDTVVGVYTGSAVGGLTEIGVDDESCEDGGAIVDFVTTPGTTYYILVTGYDAAMGDFQVLAGGSHASPPPPPPPPAPTCPPAGSPAGAVGYSGTHTGGGTVCLTVAAGFGAVTSFHVLDALGDLCHFGFAIDRFASPLAITDRHFATSQDALSGSFPSDRGAEGTFQLTRTTIDDETCTSPPLNWSATTSATPPWAIHAPPPPPPPAADTTPPALRLRGATLQRPLRRNAILVTVVCPKEACAASAAASVARVRISAARRSIPGGHSRTLRLKLSRGARRALVAALRSHRSVRTRVKVVARDGAANATTARRTITLRR